MRRVLLGLSANLESLATIPKEWLTQRAGSLRREKAALVDEALRFALGMLS